MDVIPPNSWLNLVLQIPLAVVIVFLVIRFLAFVKEVITQFLEFQSAQQKMNREQMSESLARLAEEIKSSKTDTIKEVSELTRRVDGVIDKALFLERLLPPGDHKKNQ